MRLPRFVTADLDHLFRLLFDRELARVAEVNRIVQTVSVHELDQAPDEVVDVTERTSLFAFTVERQRFAAQSLYDEVGNDAAIVLQHSWSISVEDACDTDVDLVLAVIVSHQRFGNAFTFVVARTHAYRVDVAPVVLRLRVDQRIAVNFRRRRLKDARAHAFGEAEHVDGAHDVGLYCFDRVVLIMDRGRRAREVIDLVHLEKDRQRDVVPDQFEVWIVEEMQDVLAPAGEKVIEAQHFLPFAEQTFAQMRTDKSRTSRYENPHP